MLYQDSDSINYFSRSRRLFYYVCILIFILMMIGFAVCIFFYYMHQGASFIMSKKSYKDGDKPCKAYIIINNKECSYANSTIESALFIVIALIVLSTLIVCTITFCCFICSKLKN